jgi:4,5-DOPA dioxygenase extradiol
MSLLPTLFISHGSPITALQPGLVGEQLNALSAHLPRPKAILIASAHWLSRGAEQPETIHDFGGFPRALYQLQYPAPGNVHLTKHVATLIEKAGLPVSIDPKRGFDHGIWVPLRLLYATADIPVIPLSIQPCLPPSHQFALGRALSSLREEGVLLIGSGSITHNLYDQDYNDEHEAPYVRPFIEWIESQLTQNNIEKLFDYRQQAPFAKDAHPTDEHLLPLFFAMGAVGSKHLGATRINAGIESGFLAMDTYRFDGNTLPK